MIDKKKTALSFNSLSGGMDVGEVEKDLKT